MVMSPVPGEDEFRSTTPGFDFLSQLGQELIMFLFGAALISVLYSWQPIKISR